LSIITFYGRIDLCGAAADYLYEGVCGDNGAEQRDREQYCESRFAVHEQPLNVNEYVFTTED
jgi:hypothetical protein